MVCLLPDFAGERFLSLFLLLSIYPCHMEEVDEGGRGGEGGGAGRRGGGRGQAASAEIRKALWIVYYHTYMISQLKSRSKCLLKTRPIITIFVDSTLSCPKAW